MEEPSPIAGLRVSLITFYAGHMKHYCSHISPIYLALPDDIRGKFYAQGAAHAEAVRLGIPDPIANQPRRTEGPVVVASYEDYHRVRPCAVVLVGHGVGQTYNGDPSDSLAYRHKSYSGGVKRDRVIMNICSSERDAAINREFYPDVPSVAVGVPYLDRHVVPNVESWNEYVLGLGMQPPSGSSRVVREALRAVEETWRSFEACTCPRSFSLGEILGPGFAAGTRQMLALQGWTVSWLWSISPAGQVCSSPSDGLVSYLREVAEEGFGTRSHLSQSKSEVPGWRHLLASGVLQPCSSRREDQGGKRASVSPNAAGEILPTDSLCTRTLPGGCLPYTAGLALLSYLQSATAEGQTRQGKEGQEKPTVVISSHMDATVVAETRWAFPEYKQAYRALAEKQDSLPYRLVGHWHPRAQWHMEQFWKGIGVEVEPNFDKVLDMASLYVIDNSSSAYEVASTGRPVLMLNASFYRRDVHHGLRFWDNIPGLTIDTSAELEDGISEALADPPCLREQRKKAVSVAYGGPDGTVLNDGRATERAVQALISLVGVNV